MMRMGISFFYASAYLSVCFIRSLRVQLTSFISLFLRNIIIMQVSLSITSLRLNLCINLNEF